MGASWDAVWSETESKGIIAAMEARASVDGLVDVLLSAGAIRTPAVEAAFRAVPRHLFVPGVAVEHAYRNEAIPTKLLDGRAVSSASQPSIVAVMLGQLDIERGQRVLEVGAGTGYNAALLAHLVGPAGRVVTVDIDADIVEGARAHLAAAGVEGVEVVCGDGGLGYPADAPYDRIMLTVGAWDIAPAWWEQLAADGRLLVPLSLRGVQRCIALEKRDGWRSSRVVWQVELRRVTCSKARTAIASDIRARRSGANRPSLGRADRRIESGRFIASVEVWQGT